MAFPRIISDLAGTLRTALRIGRGSVSTASHSEIRTHTLPDRTGTVVQDNLLSGDALQIAYVDFREDDSSGPVPPPAIELGILDSGNRFVGGYQFERATGDIAYGAIKGIAGGGVDAAGYILTVAVSPGSFERKVLLHDSSDLSVPEKRILLPNDTDMLIEPGMSVSLRCCYDAEFANPSYWMVHAVGAAASGGAVDSVNGQTGVVVLDGGDLALLRGIGASFERNGGIESGVTSVPIIVNHDGAIEAWKIAGRVGETGTAIFDVQINGVSIVAAAPPTITAANTATGASLTGWTTAYAAGDVFTFSTTSISGFSQVSCALMCKET